MSICNENALSKQLFQLDHLAIIKLSGADAATFLQGQLTCDIREITDETSLPAAYCNQKGRAIASMQVIKQGGEFLLVLSADLVEKVSKRLKMFVLRSDVNVEAPSATSRIFGVISPENPYIAEAPESLRLPDSEKNASVTDSTITVRMPYEPIRYLHIINQDLKIDEATSNTKECTHKWLLDDIESGYPLVTSNTSEEFIPQMLNLDLLNGIGFEKGCYTGQEIVARTHYLGKLKQRTFLARCQCNFIPESSTEIFADDSKVGSVLMATEEKQGSIVMLAVLQIAQTTNEQLYIKKNELNFLKIGELPYTF